MATRRRRHLTRTIAALAIALAAGQSVLHAQQVNRLARHGGLLVAAAGGTLQMEAAWPLQRVFRVYLYDNQMQPLPYDRLRAITGRVVIGDSASPLFFSASNNCLEARIPAQPKPPEANVRISFAAGEPEQGIYFIFSGYSDERNVVSFDLPPTPIPGNLRDLLAALRGDEREARVIITDRAFALVYAPAMRARDHLLALQKYEPRLAAGRRAHGEAALLSALRGAWLLHIAGDLGDPAQAQSAMDILSTAMSDVMHTFADAAR